MKIRYSLVELFLPNAQRKYRAQVHDQRVLTLDDLAKRMANKNTAFSAADVKGLLELMRSCTLEAIEEGYAVDSILGMLRYSIQGSFEGPEASFDRSKHTVKGNLRLYPEFVEALDKVQVEKVKPSTSVPQITSIKDGLDPDSENDTLKVGGVVKIFGNDLKLGAPEDKDSKDVGVFFIHSDGTETKANFVIDNFPSRITFLVPTTLVAGHYTIEVRTHYSEGRLLKKLMKGEYDNTIQVVASEVQTEVTEP